MGLNTRLKENIIGDTSALYPHISYDSFSSACSKEDAKVEDICKISYLNFALILDRLSKDKNLNEIYPYIDENDFYQECEEQWISYIASKKVCEFENYEQLYNDFNRSVVSIYYERKKQEESKRKAM